jgi:predicted amidophosphoribosyltransferase
MKASEMRPFDDRTRADHAYLSPADQCWWLTEYVSGHRHQRGTISRLIGSLKAAPSRIAFDRQRTRERRRAVSALADLLRGAITREWAEAATWIPIPPSRAFLEADHDQRLLPVLRRAFDGYDVDVRTILSLRQSTHPDHLSEQRSSADALYQRLQIDSHALAARPLRDRLVLFDDVVTTGKHYRCCERRLREALPATTITGLFVARRVLSGRACHAP